MQDECAELRDNFADDVSSKSFNDRMKGIFQRTYDKVLKVHGWGNVYGGKSQVNLYCCYYFIVLLIILFLEFIWF